MAALEAATGNELENLREQITCSICYTVFVEPKILPCHHTFCRQCLSDLTARGQRTRDGATRIACPTCRQDVLVQGGDVDTLEPSFMINQLKEIVARMDKEQDHPVPLPIPSAPSLYDNGTAATTCNRHPTQHLTLYCNTCSQLLCSTCVTCDCTHQLHDCGLVEDVADGLRQTLHQSLATLHIKVGEISVAVNDIALNQRRIEDEGAKISSNVAHCRKQLFQEVEQEMDQLQAFVTSITEKNRTNLGAQKAVLDDTNRQLKALIQAAGELVTSGSDLDFLARKNALDSDIQHQLDRASSLPMHFLEGPNIAAQFIKPGVIANAIRKKCSVYSSTRDKILASEGLTLEVGKEKNIKLEVVTFPFSNGSMDAVLMSKHGVVAVHLQSSSKTTVDAFVRPAQHTRGKCQLCVKVKGCHISNSPLSITVAIPPVFSLSNSVREVKSIPHPVGMALMCNGKQILVATQTELIVFNLNLEKVSSIVLPQGDKGRCRPWEVAVDRHASMYVTDCVNQALYKFSSDGTHLKSLKAKDIGATFFNGVGVNDKDILYVCDSRKHQIYTFNIDLQLLSKIGQKGSKFGEFNFPDNVAFDKKGNTYITDFNNGRVQIMSSGGKFSGVSFKKLSQPNDVFIHHGHAYVSDYATNCITVLDISGDSPSIVHRFGSNQLQHPEGVVVDDDGYVYVADGSNNRIVVF